MATFLFHDDHDGIRELLLGHRIDKIDDMTLRLDDGTEIQFEGNIGCACQSGNYDLVDLNSVDNIITRVDFNDAPASDYDDVGDDVGVYEIFVIAEDKHIRLAAFEGTDGNGYYGTGYTLIVKNPTTNGKAS